MKSQFHVILVLVASNVKIVFVTNGVAYLKNSLFCHCMSHFVFLNDNLFLQDFDGVQLIRGFFTTHNHLQQNGQSN